MGLLAVRLYCCLPPIPLYQRHGSGRPGIDPLGTRSKRRPSLRPRLRRHRPNRQPVPVDGAFSGDTATWPQARLRCYVELLDSAGPTVVQVLDSFELGSGLDSHSVSVERTLDMVSGTYYLRMRMAGDSLSVFALAGDSRYPVEEVLGYIDEDQAMGKRTGMLADGAGISGLRITAQPDPFTGRTELRYSVGQGGVVSVRIYDIFGRTVAQPVIGVWKESGRYSVELDGEGLSGGVYVVELRVGDQRVVRKILLFK